MDKKKLIGTIVGVIAFAALIAGATYAWLSNTLAVSNGVYSLNTMKFLVNYTKGTDITNMQSVSSPTTTNTKSLAVQAALASGSTPGKITIYLNTTSASNAIITGGYLKYSWCVGTCSGTNFADHTGTVSSTNKLAIVTNETLSTTAKTFNVYFWLDGAKDESSIVGLSYSGYISAEASQTES